MKKRTYCFWASMTVEAAFVIPSVLFCYIFIMYMGFYLHDSIVAENTAFILSEHLIKGCFKNIVLEKKQVDYGREWESMLTEQWDEHLAQQKDIIMSEGRKSIQDKMLMSNIENINIECNYNPLSKTVCCATEIIGNMHLPMKIFNIETAVFHSRNSITMTDAVKYLWQRQ